MTIGTIAHEPCTDRRCTSPAGEPVYLVVTPRGHRPLCARCRDRRNAQIPRVLPKLRRAVLCEAAALGIFFYVLIVMPSSPAAEAFFAKYLLPYRDAAEQTVRIGSESLEAAQRRCANFKRHFPQLKGRCEIYQVTRQPGPGGVEVWDTVRIEES